MTTTAPERITLAEFLTWDDGTDTRYELVDGAVRALPLGPVAHGAVLANLACALGNRLRPPLRGVIRAGIVPPHRADTYYLADLVATGAPPERGRQWSPEPVLIAEVVGPEEAGHDFGVKLPDYRLIPSVHEILLVSGTERRVEHWRRTGERQWILRDVIGGAELRLEVAADAAIPLAAVYENAAV